MPKNRLDKLLEQIDSSPFDHRLWEELFTLQRSESNGLPVTGDTLIKVRSYRYAYAEKYQTLPSFWLEWVRNEIEYAVGQTNADNDEKTQIPVLKLFVDALRQCPHCDIAMCYVDYVKDRHASELATANDMRRVFNEVLGFCGLDIVRGAKLWSLYLDFEVEDFEDKLELHKNDEAFGTDANTLKEAKVRLAELFHRQLSLPLMNTEETLSRLEAVTEEYFSEEDLAFLQPALLNEQVEGAVRERQSLVPFESQVSLFEEQTDNEDGGSDIKDATAIMEMVDKWCAYAHFEVERGSHQRACRVFERAVLSIHSHTGTVLATTEVETTAGVYKLWKSFVEMVVFNKAGGDRECEREGSEGAARLVNTEVTTRALKVCFAHLDIWKYHWLSLESAGTDTESLRLSHYSALQAGFTSGDDYVGVLVSWSQYLCRHIEVTHLQSTNENSGNGVPPTKRKREDKSDVNSTKSSSARGSSVEAVKALLATHAESVEYSERWLEQYYPSWEEAWLRWAGSVAEAEHHLSIIGLAQESAGTGDVWDRVLARFPNLSPAGVSQALHWRVLRCWTHPHDRINALQKCRDLHVRNIRENGRQLSSASASSAHALALTASCADWEAFERRHGDYQSVLQCLETTGATLAQHAAAIEALGRPTSQQISERDAALDVGAPSDPKAEEGSSRGEATGAASASKGEAQNDRDPSNTVHVKSIHFDATEDNVLAVFRSLAARCRGEMEGDGVEGPNTEHDKEPVVFLPRAHSGRSKGEAYVTFDSVETAELVVNAASADRGPGLSVKGRPVMVAMVAQGDLQAIKKLREAPETTTVFVSGFPKEWQAEHLQQLFSHCGDIIAGKVLKRRGPSDESPGQGMVQFRLVEGRQNAFTLNKHELDQAGRRIVIHVTLSKFPIISSSEASSAPVIVVKTDSMTVPYVPPPVTELGKAKPKRGALSFKPSSLL